MEIYCINLAYAPTGDAQHCSVRGCAFGGLVFTFRDDWQATEYRLSLCGFHFISGSVPFSMEYQDADALLCVPHHRRAYGGGGKHKYNHVPKDLYITKSANSREWVKPPFASSTQLNGIEKMRPMARRTKQDAADIRFQMTEDRLAIARLAPKQPVTHWRDPVYNAFFEVYKDATDAYTLCAERVKKTAIALPDGEPSCETCRRMWLLQKASEYIRDNPLPKPKPRPVVVTAQRPKKTKPQFEEMVALGTIELDPEAFANRRNWGERRSGSQRFYDPDSGVQRFRKTDDPRGGVNRKRG